MLKEPAIERPLGATEEMYWRFDSVTPINFGAVARLQGVINEAHLLCALDAIQARHPLLRVRVEKDDRGIPWYRSGVGSVPLTLIDAAPDTVWARLESELITPLPAEGPMMRCTLIRHAPEDATLMMVFHHAVSDGRSSVFLLRDLLQSLTAQAQGGMPDLTPLPPLEYYGERIPTLDSYDFKTALHTLKASAEFMETVGLPAGMRIGKTERVPLAQQALMIEPRQVGPELMGRVIERARQEQTTLQCVLNAALSMAVAEDSPTRPFQRTGCTQVLDIRGRLVPPVGEDVGCFASGATSLHRLRPDTPFWPLTRRIHAQLQHAIVTPLPFFFPALHTLFVGIGRGLGMQTGRRFTRMVSRLHPEGLAVSNLGRVQFSVEGSPLQVKSFGFATNTLVLNYLNTSAATCEGVMTWTFNGSAQWTRERLARIADRAVGRIEQALGE